MKILFLSLHLTTLILICCVSAISADLSERRAVGPKQATAELLQAERISPTTAVNVEERYMKLSRIIIAWHRENKPVSEVLPREKGEKIRFLIQQGQKKDAAAIVSTVIPLLVRFVEPERMNLAPSQETLEQDSTGDYTYDADNFFWGTQIYPLQIGDTSEIVNKFLKTRYLKISVQQKMVSQGGEFTGLACLPSQNDCRVTYNLDDIGKHFKLNNWSMIPMLTYSNLERVTSATMEQYVDFVDWFISKYKDDANIRYIELTNAPLFEWKGTKDQLLELNNLVYDRIKKKYPSIMVGTPGFEYMIDAPSDHKSIQEIEYFLNKENHAKFDYWAFHGYPLTGNQKSGVYPPTKTAMSNKFAGIQGILEIRKKMDKNGWHDRLIIDTEHIGTTRPKPIITYEDDSLDSAYMLQELLLKRTLRHNDKFMLSGIITLKISRRGDKEEFAWASLNVDGSLTRTVKGVRLLWSKLKDYKYVSRINGEFDNENQVWVEKFSATNKDLYIYFKPFNYQQGRTIKLDNETLQFNLELKAKPSSITLTEIDGTTSIVPDDTVTLHAVNTPRFLEITF